MIATDYIKTRLPAFTEKCDSGFDEIYEAIENVNKVSARKLLVYLDKVLNEVLQRRERDLKYSHFHFEGVNDDIIDLLAEFVAIKLFFYGLYKDTTGGSFIKNKIQALNTNSIYDSNGLTAKSAKFKKLITEHENFKRRKSFYEGLLKKNAQASLLPNSLMNVLQRGNDHFLRAFGTIPYAVPIGKFGKESSYVLLNVELSRDIIDGIEFGENERLLDHIENVIVFDCEQKQVHRDFNFQILANWNKEFTSAFKNLIVFSFSEGDFSFNRLMVRIERVQSRYFAPPKYPNYETYSILPIEIDILLGRAVQTETEIHFLGDSTCSFWKHFKDNITFYEGLYELRSIKLMNLYSLVVNEKIKEYLLSELFSDSKSSIILTEETKKSLLELSEESISELRTHLSNTLDAIINSKVVETVKASIDARTAVILPDLVLNNKFWRDEIANDLKLSKENTLVSWKSVDRNTSGNIIVLDYRDLGKFPYSISPNVFETRFPNSKSVKGIFLSFLFKNKWSWTRFNHLKDLIKILNHELREKHFDWSNFSRTNQHVDLEREETFDWDFESILQSDYEHESIKVLYSSNKRTRLYHPAELFILQSVENESLRVIRLSDIESPNKDTILKMQQLDELYAEFNLYEKLANVEREEREIQIIRDKYNLDRKDSTAGLWKLLLKRKSDEKGIEALYEEVKNFLAAKNVGFVSLNTFEKRWINPESESLITRGKRIFFHLCDYLGLEKSYVGIMLRIKNAEVQASRRSNRQMNDLLADLINDGCFNEGVDFRTILLPLKNRYIERHDFDQIAVEESKVIDTLITLVELLKPEVRLEKVEKIENI